MTLPDTVTVDSFKGLDTVQKDALRAEAFRSQYTPDPIGVSV